MAKDKFVNAYVEVINSHQLLRYTCPGVGWGDITYVKVGAARCLLRCINQGFR